MLVLKRNKLDIPPPGEGEEPTLPFGTPVKPTFEKATGLYSSSLGWC